MTEDNASYSDYSEGLRKRVQEALRGFSTEEIRQLLAEIERILSDHYSRAVIDDLPVSASVPARRGRSRPRLVEDARKHQYVARADIDHYLDLLKLPDVPAKTRARLNKLLLEAENKLGRDYEQLEFAESRATACRTRADRQRRLMESFAPGSSDWEQAERVLVNFEALAQFIEGFCREMRHKLDGIIS
jgi:hypothetical protein